MTTPNSCDPVHIILYGSHGAPLLAVQQHIASMQPGKEMRIAENIAELASLTVMQQPDLIVIVPGENIGQEIRQVRSLSVLDKVPVIVSADAGAVFQFLQNI